MVSQKIANGESPRVLIDDAKGFKHHFVARIGMLQAELDTYIRLVDKQKGLNQMMSSRILQQTIMERDNTIKNPTVPTAGSAPIIFPISIMRLA